MNYRKKDRSIDLSHLIEWSIFLCKFHFLASSKICTYRHYFDKYQNADYIKVSIALQIGVLTSITDLWGFQTFIICIPSLTTFFDKF